MKIFGFSTVFSVLLLMLCCSGCLEYRVEISDPNQQMIIPAGNRNSIVLPQANPDPLRNSTVMPKPPVPAESAAAAKTEQNFPKPSLLSSPKPPSNVPAQLPPAAAAVAPESSVHSESAEPKAEKKLQHGGPRMWRAFIRLSPEERKKLLLLQRTDPDRYRAIMQKKADELNAMEQAKREAFDALVVRYNAASTDEEKKSLLSELRRMLKEDFQQRLQDTRNHIEHYKRRTAQLEAELQKREQNCEAIIDALLNSKLHITK